MTATNHVLTGAVTATIVTNPIIAVPLAFMLHFVLDSLPHYGRDKRAKADSMVFKIVLAVDGTIALSFLLSIVYIQPQNWVLLISCAVACASPDLMWLPRWLNELKGKPNKPLGRLANFHHRIQWGERPWGWTIEIAWFLTFFWIYLARTAPY